MTVIALLGFLSIAPGAASAWPRYRAGRGRVRRICRHERLDAADVDRLVIALDRTQILDVRAVPTSADAAVDAGVRLGLDISSRPVGDPSRSLLRTLPGVGQKR